jgi:hypothetical protein
LVFRGENCAAEFCRWLFAPHNKGMTAVAHNMSGFDGYFLLNYLIKTSIRHKVIL